MYHACKGVGIDFLVEVNMIDCLLIAPSIEGGEDVYKKHLLQNPPNGIRYKYYMDEILKGRIKLNRIPTRALNSLKRVKILPPDTSIQFITLRRVYDLIHVHATPVKIFGRKKTPLIMSATSSNYVLLKDYLGWPEQKILKYYKRCRTIYKAIGIQDRLLNPKDICKLIVFSNYAKNIYLKFGVDKNDIEVIPYGVHIPPFISRSNSEEIRFLFIGIDFYRKGGPILLEAFENLEKVYPNIRLDLVTNLPEKIKIKNDKICYIPANISREQVNTLYLKDHVFVLPTLAEGFGMVIVEAMAFGLPVITTNISAIPEIFKDEKSGFLVPPNNLKVLEERMRFLIEDKNLRIKMGKNAWQRAKSVFSLEKMQESLRRVYLDTIACSRNNKVKSRR